MNKQEVLIAAIVTTGIFLISYGLLYLPNVIFSIYKHISSEDNQIGFIFSNVVGLFPIVAGIKMMNSPSFIMKLVVPQNDQLEIEVDDSLLSRLKRLSGIVVLVFCIPFLINALVGFFYFDPSTIAGDKIQFGTYLWHVSSVASLMLMTLFGVLLYKEIPMGNLYNKAKTFGLNGKN